MSNASSSSLTIFDFHLFFFFFFLLLFSDCFYSLHCFIHRFTHNLSSDNKHNQIRIGKFSVRWNRIRIGSFVCEFIDILIWLKAPTEKSSKKAQMQRKTHITNFVDQMHYRFSFWLSFLLLVRTCSLFEWWHDQMKRSTVMFRSIGFIGDFLSFKLVFVYCAVK